MPYIDATYYNDVYIGEPASSPEDLNKYIMRASDLIDQITHYQIACIGFENLPALSQSLIEKATAVQVEYYIVQGGSAEVDSGLTGDYNSVTVGAFSYSQGSSINSNNRNIDRVSPTTLDYLRSTGLLYQGIPTVGNGYGCGC